MSTCFAFVDESGDAGSSEGSSRHITLAAVITGDAPSLERIPRRIRKRRLKKSLMRKPELKFHNSSPAIRKEVLELAVALADVRLVSVTMAKGQSTRQQKVNRRDLYMLAARELILDVARLCQSCDKLVLVFDARPLNRDPGASFDDEVKTLLEQAFSGMWKIPPVVNIRRLDSTNSRGLQVADFIAGAIQRKHEMGDDSYSGIIAKRMAGERILRL